jgi:UDP-glucose 4-epimerase
LEQFLSDPQSALVDVEAVVYLASTSTPGSNLEAPWQEARNTVEVAMRVMSAIAHHSDARFIYLSSGGAIYGETTLETIPETQELHPISPYGLGKKMSEAAIDFMSRTQGLRTTILRPSNPIGRWQVSLSQGVVGALMRAARQGSVFTMIGQGTSVRDYFDVRDLSQAIKMVIDKPDVSNGQIWNVGSSRATSVQDMVDLVQDVSGLEIAVDRLPPRASDVTQIVLDTSAIRSALGWTPKHELRASIEYIWEVF